MEPNSTFFTRAAQWAGRYADTVMARDNLHLAPAFITKAAAKRLSRGIQAIEAYLRRLLLLLALTLEPSLTPRATPRPIYAAKRTPKAAESPKFSFRAFKKEGIDFALSPKFEALRARSRPLRTGRHAQISVRPLIARMRALRDLLDAPYARARRLAWTLARRRPGFLLAPGNGTEVRSRYGTEFSATYTMMAHAILQRSRARPPPLGPAPKCPPRIRAL